MTMEKQYAYSFVTVWKIKAPLPKVWDVIYAQNDWPKWWKGVKKVTPIKEGDANNIGTEKRLTWKSALPYSLSFNSVTIKVEQYKLIEGEAYGELDGLGCWYFSEADGITTVRYTWQVNTTKKWMKVLAPLLKPAFSWNHDIVMGWGGEGLAKKLGTGLVKE